MSDTLMSLELIPQGLLGKISREDATAPLTHATWYTGWNEGDGLIYRFPMGALAHTRYLTADLLVDGNRLVVFLLQLQEGEDGPVFGLIYSAVNQCAARLRMPTEAVNQNRWQYQREGAWLKPMVTGQRVDLSKVDRMTITILRKSDGPVRWCQTTVRASFEEPPLLENPLLPQGPLLDEMGQSTIHEWAAKTRNVQELVERLHRQLAEAQDQRWPASFSRWGGWKQVRVEATGYFHTYHDGQRWWLVDPEGYLFWSAGMDCVSPNIGTAYGGLDTALAWLPEAQSPYMDAYSQTSQGSPQINYLVTNFIRAFGPEQWYAQWGKITFAQLMRAGFNTVGNWSDWQVARAAGFPYVRPLQPTFASTPLIFRDFPDVFHPNFVQDAMDFAQQLRETVEDPALIGYFLMNEPTWGFAQETPAAGMLFTTSECASRVALSTFLQERYGDEDTLAAAWGSDVSFASLQKGVWSASLTLTAQRDLEDFSAVMVERLFKGLGDACRAVDPHHLNLGARYYTVPPAWAVHGMRSFDVFSINAYQNRVPSSSIAPLSVQLNLPVMIGEWHFGALDVGLPGSGIGHVRDQAARGQAFRIYAEDAASQPWCIGVHYFTFYDESALGRFDGENWNIGFFDTCNRPYEPLVLAARASHERIYPVAQGELAPYSDEPEYLPKLFL